MLLVLALVAGPAASALCAHVGLLAGEHGMGEMDHAAMGHSAMADMAMAPEAAPCHEEPVPEPEPNADCLSACCVADAPAPVVPPLALDAPPSMPLATVAVATLTNEDTLIPTPEPQPPPEARLRVHLLLGRFLS